MAVQLAEPSSYGFANKFKYRYDVFLSFRGEDTRHSFTVFLYDALRRKGINAFIDDKKLGKGERISPALLKAIEKSRISIIVFSRNYATSTWCLEELAHIIRCKKEKNQLVIPIFYKVDPMDVRYQTNSFGEAMTALEDRFKNDPEKVQKWRLALSEAASLSSAWLFKDGYELGFIESIVKAAYAILPPKPFYITDYMVGLEPRMEKVMSLLDDSNDGVCMLGIHGTGGLGKTTLAKALYNSIFYHFEGACFLFDVREASKKQQGIIRLQQKLLLDILGEKRITIGSADEGITRIKHRLSHKKVLLVLDDVDETEQLEKLAGGSDWFGCGSKVIITTRNKQLLIEHNVQKRYKVMGLEHGDSLKLFCWYAFHMSQPPKGYQEMSHHVLSYAQGLPLALRLIGSNLAQKNFEEWRSTLEQYDRIPERTIHEVLKISYDCLKEDAKCIFLDIACFFEKEMLDSIEEAFDFARLPIEVLVDKSLITIAESGHLYMHDLIRQMGREIVRQEAPSNPEKRSRLWYYKDVLTILSENLGSNNIEGIMLDPPQQEEVEWSGEAFKKMNNLRILIVRNARLSTGPKYFPNSLRWLDWEGFPSATLPPEFSPEKLVFLNLSGSPFRLEEPLKGFEYVTYVNFSDCEFITEVPDMSQFQNLRRLLFQGCDNLIKVHDSVGSLSKLVELNLSECTKLASFPHEIKMSSLQMLYFTNCRSLDYFPHIVGKMDALKQIYAEETAIKELPPSIGDLLGLTILCMKSCKSLKGLPNKLFTLQNLICLELDDTQLPSRKSLMKSIQESPVISCTNLVDLKLRNCCLLDEELHQTLKNFQNLEMLTLSGNDFVSLPECIKECFNLEKLEVNNCKRLRDIPELPSKLKRIEAENCTSLTTESLGHLWSQVTKEFSELNMFIPAPAFPDWFNDSCKGGTLSLCARGSLPHVAVAFELGKVNRSINGRKVYGRKDFVVSMSINGHKIERRQRGRTIGTQGHAMLFDLRIKFWSEEWERLAEFQEFDWHDVKIEFISDSPDMSVVRCGIYVYKQQTNIENVRFKSSLLSMNAPTTSLKRRVISSPPNEPAKKLMRKLKATDKGKLNNRKKGIRRIKRHRSFHSCYKKKMVFPMGMHVRRFLYN